MTELMPSLCNDCVARNQCGNDDVKMCISYTKETKIKCDDCKFVEDCVDYGWEGCRKFTPKLKRCPFCGSEAKTGRIFGHDTVYCSECDACILPSPYNSFANTEKELGKSIETWNKRVVAE